MNILSFFFFFYMHMQKKMLINTCSQIVASSFHASRYVRTLFPCTSTIYKFGAFCLAKMTILQPSSVTTMVVIRTNNNVGNSTCTCKRRTCTIHVCTCMCMYTMCVHTYMYTCMYLFVHACTHIHTHTCTYAHT